MRMRKGRPGSGDSDVGGAVAYIALVILLGVAIANLGPNVENLTTIPSLGSTFSVYGEEWEVVDYVAPYWVTDFRRTGDREILFFQNHSRREPTAIVLKKKEGGGQ